jgi:DNA-binding response OmpR family regulator
MSAAKPLKRVLVVDDEPEIVRLLKDVFASFRHAHAYAVDSARDGVEALTALRHGEYDLVVLDMNMPRMDGLELLKQMRALSMEVPVLMLTGNQSTSAAIDAISAQVFSYMSKPLELHYFEHIVALALSSPRPTVGGSTVLSVRATGVPHLDPQSASR